jgi:formate-dependent nitrite reductase membrane component NrfD
MNNGATSYYGKPIIKEPVWKPEIPNYFFVGGVAGGSATLSAAARLAGNDVLARRSLLVAAAGVGVSPYFLIKDLGRPRRFYNMLRVFKVTSPMSVGTWILSAEGASTGIAAACELWSVLPRVRAVAQSVSGLLGPAMASYTGALVADSVVPAWHEGRRELPLVFAGSAAAAAGGFAAAVTPAASARPARRFAVLGAVTEVVVQKLMEKRMGELVSEPYRTGEGGRYARAAQVTMLAGAALMTLAGHRRAGATVAGALLAAGSWCGRFSVLHAGKASAADPTYTSVPQRARAAEWGS